MLGSLAIVFGYEERGFVYGVDGDLPQARVAIAACIAAGRDARRGSISVAGWFDC